MEHIKETPELAVPTGKCDECKGHGIVEKTIYRGDEGMEIEMDVEVDCDECDGTGSIEIEMDLIADCPECDGTGKS